MCKEAEGQTGLQPASHDQDSANFKALQEIVPATPICQEAFTIASQHLSTSILNHSMRVYLYSKKLALRFPPATPSPNLDTLLFVASIFHDMGTSDHLDGPERFEVCGAEAAKSFLRDHSFSETDAHDVWIAIACHTSPQIAERITPLSKIIRLAVLADFDRPGLRTEFEFVTMAAQLEETLPRLEIEKVLGDAVVKQIMGKAEGPERLKKAPHNSWPDCLLRGHLEAGDGYVGVNKYF